MPYTIHIIGDVEAPRGELKAVEEQLHAKFTAALLELHHVRGHGLISASFLGSHVTEHLQTLPVAGTSVVMDEQDGLSIRATRAPKAETPGASVRMDEQATDEIARGRALGAARHATVGHVLDMDEQSAASIAASRVAREGPPPGSAALYADQGPVRFFEESLDDAEDADSETEEAETEDATPKDAVKVVRKPKAKQ